MHIIIIHLKWNCYQNQTLHLTSSQVLQDTKYFFWTKPQELIIFLRCSKPIKYREDLYKRDTMLEGLLVWKILFHSILSFWWYKYQSKSCLYIDLSIWTIERGSLKLFFFKCISMLGFLIILVGMLVKVRTRQ